MSDLLELATYHDVNGVRYLVAPVTKSVQLVLEQFDVAQEDIEDDDSDNDSISEEYLTSFALSSYLGLDLEEGRR